MFTIRRALRKTSLLRFAPSVALAGALGCMGQIGRGTKPAGGHGGERHGRRAGARVGAGRCRPRRGGALGTAGAGATGGGAQCAPLPPIQRRLWRLSPPQWSNAVRDLLALTSAPAVTDTGGASEYAFFTDTTLGMTPEFQYALYDRPSRRCCRPSPPRSAARRGRSRRAAARPPRPRRPARRASSRRSRRRRIGGPSTRPRSANLMNVYAQGAMQDYVTGISLMIQAVLISPSFVYRTELGPATLTADASGTYPDTTLTPHEIATQLGFLFLGSVPDDQLMAAADDGSLATADGLSAQIDRLLANPQVQANLTSIMIDWFNVRQMFSKTKDTSLFSALATADQDQVTLENDIYTSTQKFVHEVLWTNPSGTVDDLVTSPSVWVNKRLATLFPGLSFPNGAPTSNTSLRESDLVGFGRPRRDVDAARVPVGRVGPGGHVHREARQVHSRRHPLPGRDLDGHRPVDLVRDERHQLQVTGRHDDAVGVRQRGAPVRRAHEHAAVQGLPRADGRVFARPPQLWTDRQLSNDGRGRSPHRSHASRSCRIRRSRPAWPPAPRRSRRRSPSSGVLRGCSVQKVASYAIGDMIRTYDTCELDDLRAQTQRHALPRCSRASRWRNSSARAREVPSDVLQVQATGLPAGVRRVGRSARPAAAVDRSARARGEGAAPPAHRASPPGSGARSGVVAAERQPRPPRTSRSRSRAPRSRRRGSSPT